MASAGQKRCSDCKTIKELSEFGKNQQSPDGLSYYCKTCFRARSAASYRRRLERTGTAARGPYQPRRDVPEGMKWCPDCEAALPVDDFVRNKSARDGLSGYCRGCQQARVNSSREKVHGSTRHYHLMHRYGISEAEAEAMKQDQANECAICRQPDPGHVDHDHKTGEVRGILCFTCNAGLGNFKDDVERMLAAARYLERKKRWSMFELDLAAFQHTS